MRFLQSFTLAAFPISCFESIGQSILSSVCLIWNIAQPVHPVSEADLSRRSHFGASPLMGPWRELLCPLCFLHWVPELHSTAPYWTAAGSLTPLSWGKKEQIRILYFWFIEVIIYFFNCTFTCVLGRCVSTPKCIKCEDINHIRDKRYQESPVLLELTGAWHRCGSAHPTRQREPGPELS